MRIRRAEAADLPRLQDIERAAGEPFRELGMVEIADDEPPATAVLERYRAAGRAWVAVDGDSDSDSDDRPIAYLIHDTVDGAAHVEQVSVHPDAAHRGLGRALIDHLGERAAAEGLTGLTLTTFSEVPWNAPYYTRIGFRELAEPELTDGLREIRRAEKEHGLDRWPRVCMRRDLPPAGSR
ncbi:MULTISPECIES: GNAT family N-acetyltransferase [Streptomyces]|uniref:GNAT family N-acetyltransferase n=1 Tax=Streptomyces tsukubensis (strain DSM 42081 / NBRC 108919 / NRRL 18488 / 9993) TaxID=1114943 RepID=I2N8W0_STRT9|nr:MULTISPECIES: GNAT family N-acetyltransferase [Streptomyces]AZK97324.1 GNAT family N-acetyltransferase [Streptomyces tsukubensis]EIF93457.1 GCN5-like N-acetyltransferase [Streptomyces tsukubensis NRRL18488]MYS67284.1 GNAT family N-acetyltransferase [Streptomyces sp. SID5473]QKM66716.1 GNAT family N-acetyltransferase [Streptomyces tsukubensis NRRL18488]TAI44937.1 GNAT family N-acetyltransferase [Streptomyces tsukubensis]